MRFIEIQKHYTMRFFRRGEQNALIAEARKQEFLKKARKKARGSDSSAESDHSPDRSGNKRKAAKRTAPEGSPNRRKRDDQRDHRLTSKNDRRMDANRPKRDAGREWRSSADRKQVERRSPSLRRDGPRRPESPRQEGPRRPDRREGFARRRSPVYRRRSPDERRPREDRRSPMRRRRRSKDGPQVASTTEPRRSRDGDVLEPDAPSTNQKESSLTGTRGSGRRGSPSPAARSRSNSPGASDRRNGSPASTFECNGLRSSVEPEKRRRFDSDSDESPGRRPVVKNGHDNGAPDVDQQRRRSPSNEAPDTPALATIRQRYDNSSDEEPPPLPPPKKGACRHPKKGHPGDAR